ncbi:MAG: hypothetical protein EU550_02880 [Promethearchaeota archaeon]|nr:MAG: hypothetical protein EU550_02880 [Candidatus Lokiarchaeota archaeon]
MPDVTLKSPNLDDVFEKWKQKTLRTSKKKLEKEFGTKGAVFSLDNISAAETVKETEKEAAIYFEIKKTVAPAKGKEQKERMRADKVEKETFFTFKGKSVNKDNWKGDDVVPIYETIETVPCTKCGGKGYQEEKCKTCKGSGKIEDQILVLEGEEQKKEKKPFSYPCPYCYGSGKAKEQCSECGGFKNFYEYEVLPVPYKTVVEGKPVLFSSAKTKYEKEIGEDLQKLIEEVQGIKFTDPKTLDKKAEASLGYYNKNIKKMLKNAIGEYKDYDKDDDTKITTPMYLFPVIQMFCETKRGKSFEIYSIGSDQKFITYSNF